MSVRQLIFRERPGADGADVTAVEKNVGDRVWDFEDVSKSERPAILGTAGLLKLALSLVAAGYRLTRIELSDLSYEPLHGEFGDSGQTETQLLESIRSGRTTADDLFRSLEDDGLAIVQIAVKRTGGGYLLQINRDGELRTTSEGSWNEFVRDIGQILRPAV